MKKFLSKSVTVLLLAFSVTGMPGLNYAPVYAANVSVWWPTNNVQVAAVQPFKALVDGMPLSDYSMYWQVDNGQLNLMSDNYTDAPHKQVSVDLSNWHWQSSGAYQVNFVAKDKNGSTIGNRTVTIYVNQSAPAAPVVVAAAPVVAQTPTPAISTSQPVSSSSTGNSTGGTIVAQASPAPAPAISNISTWWPADGSSLTGAQPFKALLDNASLSSYSMYWQVDNGQMNLMSDNTNDGPHKEALVDLTNWNWKGSGPYSITFTAKSPSLGTVIASKSFNIYVGSKTSSQTSSSVPVTSNSVPTTTTTATNNSNPTPVASTPAQQPPIVTPAPAPSPTTIGAVSMGSARSGDPLSGVSLYVDPNSPSALQAKTWTTSNQKGATDMMKIAVEPVGKWFGGWNSNIQSDTAAYVSAAAAQGSIPVLISYNIPFRDCGGYSAGGATTPDAYNAWISGMAKGIGSNKAVVILEPDALAGITCLSATDQSARYVMLQNAVATLKANKGTSVYIDAGNSNWVSASDMAPRLKNAGVALADGFALNVSNFYATSDLTGFGNSLSPLVGNKHFVIDTSRNGLGPLGSEWCNPSGRALGNKPTSNTGNTLTDAFLWLKTPGESDGNCNGGPSAGVWWPDYAVGLAERASY